MQVVQHLCLAIVSFPVARRWYTWQPAISSHLIPVSRQQTSTFFRRQRDFWCDYGVPKGHPQINACLTYVTAYKKSNFNGGKYLLPPPDPGRSAILITAVTKKMTSAVTIMWRQSARDSFPWEAFSRLDSTRVAGCEICSTRLPFLFLFTILPFYCCLLHVKGKKPGYLHICRLIFLQSSEGRGEKNPYLVIVYPLLCAINQHY